MNRFVIGEAMGEPDDLALAWHRWLEPHDPREIRLTPDGELRRVVFDLDTTVEGVRHRLTVRLIRKPWLAEASIPNSPQFTTTLVEGIPVPARNLQPSLVAHNALAAQVIVQARDVWYAVAVPATSEVRSEGELDVTCLTTIGGGSAAVGRVRPWTVPSIVESIRRLAGGPPHTRDRCYAALTRGLSHAWVIDELLVGAFA